MRNLIAVVNGIRVRPGVDGYLIWTTRRPPGWATSRPGRPVGWTTCGRRRQTYGDRRVIANSFSIICACAIAARDRADNCLHRTNVLDRACAAVAIDVRELARTREDRTDEDGAARGVVGGIVIEDGQVPGNHGIRVDGECVISGVDAGASLSADRVGEGRHGRQDGGGHGSGRGVGRGAEAHDDPESHSLLFLTFLGCSIFRCFYCYMIIALLLYLRCVFFMYGPSFVSNSGAARVGTGELSLSGRRQV